MEFLAAGLGFLDLAVLVDLVGLLVVHKQVCGTLAVHPSITHRLVVLVLERGRNNVSYFASKGRARPPSRPEPAKAAQSTEEESGG